MNLVRQIKKKTESNLRSQIARRNLSGRILPRVILWTLHKPEECMISETMGEPANVDGDKPNKN